MVDEDWLIRRARAQTVLNRMAAENGHASEGEEEPDLRELVKVLTDRVDQLVEASKPQAPELRRGEMDAKAKSDFIRRHGLPAYQRLKW